MRDLTPEECEFIAGGLVRGARHLDNEVAPVVVVASPPPYYPPPYYPPPAPPPYYPPPPPGGGGGGGGGYTPSAAANAFAASHMHLLGDLNDPNTAKVYNAEHTALAKIYDFATNNPNAVIQEPNGESMTAAQMLQELQQVQVYIGTDAELGGAEGATGAATTIQANGQRSIYIDPNNSTNTYDYRTYGDAAGADYPVFHELGHALVHGADATYQASTNPTDQAYGEAIANSEGADLAAAVGLAYPTDAQLANRGGTVPH